MDHGKPKIGISGAYPFAAIALNHDQSAVDLLPPIHPGGIFLSDEATLGEADAVQLDRIALQPEQVAEFGVALAYAEAEAVIEPAFGGIVSRCYPPPPQFL